MSSTAKHPLHSGDDRGQAVGISPGDVITDRVMLPLTVLAVRLDDTPQLVHNLEIGGAHTYFVGELDAWAHNAWNTPSTRTRIYKSRGGKCQTCGISMPFSGPKTGPRAKRFSVGHLFDRKNYPQYADENWNLFGQCCSCNSQNGANIESRPIGNP